MRRAGWRAVAVAWAETLVAVFGSSGNRAGLERASKGVMTTPKTGRRQPGATRKCLSLLLLLLATAGRAASGTNIQNAGSADAALRIDLPASGEVRVENRRGGVSMEVWDEKFVSVSAVVEGARAPRRSPVRLERSESLLSVSVAPPGVAASSRVDLRLRVPSNARVSLFTGSGEIEARDVPASLAAQTVSGDIHINLLAPHDAQLTAHSLNGQVVFQNDDGTRSPQTSRRKFETRLGTGGRTVRLFSGRGQIDIATHGQSSASGRRQNVSPDVPASSAPTPTRATVAASSSPRSPATQNRLTENVETVASARDENAATRTPPALKGSRGGTRTNAPAPPAPQAAATPDEVEEDEVVRVETELVRLNIGVTDRASSRGITGLVQSDFKLYEDSAEQELLHFETASAPFDLVLLIDLSGSTGKVTGIIRAAALRFIEVARPQDRVGIITFAGSFDVVSPLTTDREALRTRINAMERPKGDTRLYDAINFAMEQIARESAESRRRAIVLMSDGLDSTLPNVTGVGSTITYEDLRSRVQEFDGVFYALWTSTEYEAFSPDDIQPETFDLVHDRMQQLAEAGGGVFYPVERLEDLAGTYDRVVADLGTLYSLAYKPTNKTRDGRWRTIRVRLPRHPAAVARGKRGYFAK